MENPVFQVSVSDLHSVINKVKHGSTNYISFHARCPYYNIMAKDVLA